MTIRDGLVTTHVDQLFRNDTPGAIEGQYVFPLPAGAVVSDFSMWVDGEKLEARILPADEAREIYEDYVRQVRDPALLEYIGRDTLAARIFPIPPDGKRRIELSYTQVLSAENGLYRYRYPLDTERFSAHPLENITIDVDLRTTGATQAIYSPSHKVTVLRQDETQASVHYAQEDGFFMLVLSPQVTQSPGAVAAKDLVLVLDRSGSMYGEKIAQAKEALSFILRHLNPEDRFAVVAFSDLPTSQSDRLRPVTSEAVGDAVVWVNRIEADGGTNIDAALLDQIRLYGESEEPVDEVIRLSTRYGIITPYTSFLVEEEGLSPQEMADALVRAAAAPASGQKAVAGATSVRTLAEEEAFPPEQEAVRIVGDRTFFLKDGVWTETSYDGQETIDIAAFGPGCFELVARFPELAPILAVGEEVVFALDSVYIRVGAQGAETLPDSVNALS